MRTIRMKWISFLLLGCCVLLISSCGKDKNDDMDSEDPKGESYGMATADIVFESGKEIDYKGSFKSKILLVSMGNPEDDDYKWRLAGAATMIQGDSKHIFGFTADIRGEGTYELHVTGQANLGSELRFTVADKDDFGALNGVEYRPILMIDNEEKKGASTLIITSLTDTHLKGTFSGVFYNKKGEKVTISNGVIDVDIDKQG